MEWETPSIPYRITKIRFQRQKLYGAWKWCRDSFCCPSTRSHITHFIWRRSSIWAGPVSETASIWSGWVFWRSENFPQKNPAQENSSNLYCSTDENVMIFTFIFFMNLKRTPLISLQKRIFPWQKSAFEIKCDIIFDVEFISDVQNEFEWRQMAQNDAGSQSNRT